MNRFQDGQIVSIFFFFVFTYWSKILCYYCLVLILDINGPTGLLIGAGKGVIRSMYCKSSGYGDYLPVDYAVNGVFVASWNFIYNK